MKIPRMAVAMGAIDDAIITDALSVKAKSKAGWQKWAAMAASFALLLVAVLSFLPTGTDAPPHITQDGIFVKGYSYAVSEGDFSSYVGGKVIDENKLTAKMTDVTVRAGWKNAAGDWCSEIEVLRGELYGIAGVPAEVAVALKFIDKGEAVTTTHYYVILNPAADLTAVREYVIPPITPNESGD